MEIYIFEGDVVLDPFIDSGTTAIAACKSHLHFIGFDISADFVALSNSRLDYMNNL
jgi:DNA modification methylase